MPSNALFCGAQYPTREICFVINFRYLLGRELPVVWVVAAHKAVQTGSKRYKIGAAKRKTRISLLVQHETWGSLPE